VPLFVVGADHDRFIPLDVSRQMARKYGAQLYVAEGHGHFLLAEPGWQKEAQVILDWIDSIEENRSSAEGISPATIHRSSSRFP
jgi:pimeloyl-ACP methyl ester carboxylesterase